MQFTSNKCANEIFVMFVVKLCSISKKVMIEP